MHIFLVHTYAVSPVKKHIDTNFLRGEFIWHTGQHAGPWHHSKRVQTPVMLLHSLFGLMA